MDGVLRTHPSEGIHDPLYARALVLSDRDVVRQAYALVSVDVCVLDGATCSAVCQGAEARTGSPASHIIVAATHTHSGPSALGILTPREDGYVQELNGKLVTVIDDAARNLRPTEVGVASGRENTISHYRRLPADDGHVVMNWEPYPPEQIVGPLGAADPEVGVVKVVWAGDPNDPAKPGRVLATSPPFVPEIRDGRLYGLGTIDMKGAMGAMAVMYKVIAEKGLRLKGDLNYECVVDEEEGGVNATIAGRLRYGAVDGALIPEGTDLKIYPATRRADQRHHL